jgi:hypothetical protein
MNLEALLADPKCRGSDPEFREWCRTQPSCISGRFSEWHDGRGYCDAAHVRRAGESGTGFKAAYACVRLTRAEHSEQHQHGELYETVPQRRIGE